MGLERQKNWPQFRLAAVIDSWPMPEVRPGVCDLGEPAGRRHACRAVLPGLQVCHIVKMIRFDSDVDFNPVAAILTCVISTFGER